MHNAWTKHLVARQVIVDARLASHVGDGEDGYDGTAGETLLQRAEDALYTANMASYNTLYRYSMRSIRLFRVSTLKKLQTRILLGSRLKIYVSKSRPCRLD